MNRLITIIVIILLIIAAYFLFRDNTPGVQNNNGASNEEEYTVVYTNSGFSPQTITVDRGDTVIFENRSSREMWVASDPHPTHTDYPAFDEEAAVVNGGRWTFTFGQTGEWGYHNHRNASSTGTVVVQ